MSDSLEPWKRRGVKKGRVRANLLESGPAPLESLLVLARLDDPQASLDTLEQVLEAAPHKFYRLSDGRFGAYPDEEVRTIYRPAYQGPPKKRKKRTQRGELEGVETPDAPTDGRFGVGEDGIPTVIIMGDELMMTGSPRLLIEFKNVDEQISEALKSSIEEETQIRFFLKVEDRILFIGTRSILDLVTERSGRLRAIASPAADDARRAIAPAPEQRLLLETRQEGSALPVPLDGSVVVPYAAVPSLGEAERRSLSIPAAPRQSDAHAVRSEFLEIRARLSGDPAVWAEVLPFLAKKKPLVDARTYEKLLLMAINAPNAKCHELIEALNLYLGEEPDPGFALHVVEALSRSGDPEGKIASLVEEYADIARCAPDIDRQAALALARAFFRGDGRYDEAARCFAKALESGEGLPRDDLGKAAATFLFARDIGREGVEGFLGYLQKELFESDSALPDAPGSDFLDLLGGYLELVERYRPGGLIETVERVLGYLTAVQEEEAARRYYLQYRPSVRKFVDQLDLLSFFENCESRETLEWAIERTYEAFAERRDSLTPAMLSSAAGQLAIEERLAGREPFYSADVRAWMERDPRQAAIGLEQGAPLLKAHGIGIVAVFGGDERYRLRMRELLVSLGASRVIAIPPSFESRLDQSGLKEKLRSAELVLHVATHTKHADHYMLENIKKSPELSFRVVRVNGGPSRGLRELHAALAS